MNLRPAHPVGLPLDAVAELVDDEAEKAAAYQALIDKYGWKMKVLNLGSKLSGKIKTRALIRLHF